MSREKYRKLLQLQEETPVVVMRSKKKGRTLWMFENEFYWGDKCYTVDEVETMILVQQMGLQPFDQHVSLAVQIRAMNRYHKQSDELHRQSDGLRRHGDELKQQGDTYVALGRWMDGHIKAEQPLTTAEVEDQMLGLGFIIEDIQDLRVASGADIIDKVRDWMQPRLNAIGAQLGAIGVQMEAIAAQMEAIGAQKEAASAEMEAIMAEISLGLPEPIPVARAPIPAEIKAIPGEREPIPDWMRRAALDRDQGICRYCGRRAMTLHLDHVMPVSQGGRSTIENLVTTCAKCNLKKGGRTPKEAGTTLLPPGTLRG